MARFVTRLLRGCPRLRMICTSRERLRVAGEHVSRLSGLVRADAVLLFAERAAAARPGFRLTPEVAPAVAHVCRRLDGMPLAIELAAARMGAFGVAQVAERLADRFCLLEAGERGGEDRHRTLRAVIDWSYDLLTEAEQTIFDGLAVFVGGFTFEAAEAVCALLASEVDMSQVLDRLVDKSFVQAEAPATAAAYRYRLLETLRDYGARELRRRGLVDALRARHGAYFQTLAKQAADGLRGADQPAWLERLAAEHDNLRAALAWFLETGRAEEAGRLAGAIYPFWDLTGLYREGRQWLERALAAGELTAPVRTRVLMGVTTLAVLQGDAERATEACAQAEALSRAAGDAAGLSHALNYQGFITQWAEDFDRSDRLLAEAEAVATESGAAWELGWALIFRSTLSLSREDWVTAIDCTHRSDAALTPVGDLEAAGWNCLLRGGAYWVGGDHEQAGVALRSALVIFARLGAVLGLSQTFMLTGFLLTNRGRHLAAARFLGAGAALRDLAGTGQFPFLDRWVATARAEVSAVLGDDRAREAWLSGAKSDWRPLVTEGLRLIAAQPVAGV
ncbi:ATP-binding protein [Paractinoplanes atraurantiacus]|uniref:Non-specific serine/threonine protein kinase n=1 Tax=Paractinoplanes atraurantiacus TaxID=1036182 RepID=A0A285KQ26_9ACTN|nr:hypothetical protein [Actinoplanes atraurantiacus]SNY73411.1 non-specific serine/threonine protein kinase [Actinoplanes atraurantiacus]